MGATALVWDLIAKDQASPAFLRVAGAADKAAVATSRATKGMNAHVVSAGKLGAKLTKNLTVPLLALSGVAVSQAVKFQKSMTLIQTAGGETAAKAAEISVGIKKIATATGSNLNALSDGIYAVAKAGAVKWSAVEQLGVLKAAAQGAKAENVDLGTSVNALTSVMTSYGYSADKAVSVENMLIRGSGLAKTTMQDFAGSLSTVVPLAGALHISFSQVAGAIATMTQHGESAQQATENLNNLITNLAGQNNVASSAMQQLGINTVDLSKNLGKRGLTGTLAIVEAALKAHTKNGLVVTDVHKAAALATKSLNTEMGTFSGDLKAQSAALLTGGTSIAAYMKYAKSLGGVQGASALQFLSLYKSSKGFSDQLKAGNGTARTTTATMQKLLGGMTGMGAVLKLNGRDAHLFGQNVAEVAKASRESGTDVLGWAKTQDTLAVKLDKAKASLQVLAVEVGTALIPAITKIVSGVSSAVHWFENLSGTQKKVLAWTAGVLIALGPILSIGTRLATVGRGLSTFAATAGTRIASLAGASEATAARVGTAMRRVSGAVGAVLAGTVAGQIGGGGTSGWLTSIFLGTAAGAAMGSPITAVIGGVSAAISKGIGLWGKHKDAASAAIQAEIQYVNSLTDAIARDNGAIGANTRLSQNKRLGDAGVLSLAQSVNIPLQDVLNASLGKGGKLQGDILGQAQRLFAERASNAQKLIAQNQSRTPDGGVIKSLTARNADIDKYLAKLKTVQDALAKMGIDVGKAGKNYDLQFRALNATRVESGKYADQLERLHKGLVTAENTDGSLIHTLKGSTDAAQHNRAAFLNLAAAAQQDAEKTFASKVKHEGWRKALADAQGTLTSHIAQIKKAGDAAGFNKSQIAALIGTYGKFPKSITTYIKKHGVLPADIQAIIDKLNEIPSYKTVTIGVNQVNVGKGSSTYGSQVPGHAAGGGVADGWFTSGEAGWELGHKEGSKVTFLSHAKSVAMTGMNKLPGYASGTDKVSGPATTLLQTIARWTSTMSEVKSAAKALIAAAKSQKDSAATLTAMGVATTTLVNDAKARDRLQTRLGTAPTAATAYDKLATAKGNYSGAYNTVRSAVTGSFDITTAGQSQQVYSDRAAAPTTAGSILAAFKAQAAKATRFAAVLKKLRAEGMPSGLVYQLAQAGPSALDQALALAKSTPAQIAGFGAANKAINVAGKAGAKSSADALYGGQVQQAKAYVAQLTLSEKKLTASMEKLGTHLENLAKGIPDKKAPVVHVHGVHDPNGVANSVSRRLQHMAST